MSIFAFYFASQLLGEAGWPRKLGRFKGEGYDAWMVDAAFAQSMNWGAGLGAGRPRLALQMIAEITRDSDWEGDDAPDMKGLVSGWLTHDSFLAAASPEEAVELPRFAERMSTISVEVECPRFRGHLSAWSAQSDRARRMSAHAKGIELPEAVPAGVSA